MTRAIMNGCNGKMGQCITGICAQDEDIEIVAGIDTYTGITNDYPVFASLSDCNVEADVIIDFSNAKAVDALLDYAVDKQIPVVLCTTGLSEEQLKKVEKTYEKVAILKSANMSLGINTLMELLKKAALVFAPAGFDMEIVEKHHNQKLDAPSGTALALADSMNEALDNAYTYKYDRSQERSIPWRICGWRCLPTAKAISGSRLWKWCMQMEAEPAIFGMKMQRLRQKRHRSLRCRPHMMTADAQRNWWLP